jgi:HEAT repeat protein
MATKADGVQAVPSSGDRATAVDVGESMSKYRGVLLLAFAALLAGCGKSEPLYKGKPAAYWSQALKGADPTTRREAMTAAGALHIKTAVPDLLAALNDGDDDVRAKAAEALWSLGGDAREGAPALASLLKDRSAAARLNAAGALGAIGRDAAAVAVAPLRETLRDADPYVRAQAADSLGQFGPAAGVASPDLARMLGDREKNVRVAAGYALAGLGSGARDALPALNDAAQDRDGDVRTAALYAVKKIQEGQK